MRELKLPYCLVVIKFVLVKTSNQKSYSNKYSIQSDWTILENEYGTRKCTYVSLNMKLVKESLNTKLVEERLNTKLVNEYLLTMRQGYTNDILNLNIMHTDFFKNQRLSRACIVHLVIKKTNWSYVKTMSCVILELRST